MTEHTVIDGRTCPSCKTAHNCPSCPECGGTQCVLDNGYTEVVRNASGDIVDSYEVEAAIFCPACTVFD
jgi:hypothetical protein